LFSVSQYYIRGRIATSGKKSKLADYSDDNGDDDNHENNN